MRRTISLFFFSLCFCIGTAAQTASFIKTFTVRDGLPSNVIADIRQDESGLIWIATWNGLCYYDGYRFTSLNGNEWGGSTTLSTKRILSVKPDEKGQVLVRTHDGQQYLLDTYRSQYLCIDSTLHAVKGRPMEKLDTASEAGQWIRLHPEYSIEKTLVDRQGNLWFSTKHGLSQVNFRHYSIRQLEIEPEMQTRSVTCRKDGTVWAGTYGGYIAVFDSEGQRKGWLTPQGKVSTVMTRFAKQIYALFEDSEGRLWIGTREQGLYVVSADGASVSLYQHQEGDPYSLSHNAVYDFDQDEQGNIWIATYGGGVNVVRSGEVKSGKWRFVNKGNELRRYPKKGFEEVRRITHDKKGHLFASTTRGLLTFASQIDKPGDLSFHTSCRKKNDTTSLRTNDVMQVLVSSTGSIYVLTMSGGVQLLTSSDVLQDQLQFEDLRDIDNGAGICLSMVEDPEGNIWITRESEINCYFWHTRLLRQFSHNSIDGGIELSEAKPVIDANGNFWGGAMGGVLTFNTQDIQRSDFKPTIIFTSISFQGERQERPILNREEITIEQKEQRTLTVNFAALDYGDNYLMQYAYRMDDNEEWNYIGHHPHITFSQLPAGRHTLFVRSTNCDGVWTDNQAELVIDVEPTFFERTWVRHFALFILIALCTLAGIIYANRSHKGIDL